MNSNASYPKVVMNDKGNATVVWQQSINFISNIRSNHFTGASLSWIGAELIESESGEAFRPEIAIDPYGNVRAVWSQLRNNERGVMTNIRYVGSAAWPRTATHVSITAETGDAYSPVIAIDAFGRGIAVWQQTDGQRDSVWFNI